LDEIAKLKSLLDDGAITQDEYDAEKAKLLAAGETTASEVGESADPADGASYTDPASGSQPGGQQQQQWDGQRQGQPNFGSPYGSGHIPGTPYNNYQEDVATNKVFGVLSYLAILCFVSIFAAPKESHYARFHANQGLVLFIFEIIGSIVFAILGVTSGMFGVFSFGVGFGFAYVLHFLYNVAMLVLIIIGIVNAMKGVEKPLPVIGGITILGNR
jgi:uncharacterized membrane protein